MKRVILIVTGIVLFAAGIYAQPATRNVKWELTELNGRRVTNSDAFLQLGAAGRLTGNAGCNRIFGSYELAGESFDVKNTGSTKMACSPAATMRMEREFIRALNDATRLRVNGRNMVLFVGRERVLRFKAERRTLDDGLAAKKWMLASIGGRVVNLRKDAPFLNFDSEKGSAGGNSGCNVFGGDYNVTGARIKFGDIMSTMRACEFEERMAIERRFLDGLRNADRFEVKGNKLWLFKGDRELLAFDGVAK